MEGSVGVCILAAFLAFEYYSGDVRLSVTFITLNLLHRPRRTTVEKKVLTLIAPFGELIVA